MVYKGRYWRWANKSCDGSRCMWMYVRREWKSVLDQVQAKMILAMSKGLEKECWMSSCDSWDRVLSTAWGPKDPLPLTATH